MKARIILAFLLLIDLAFAQRSVFISQNATTASAVSWTLTQHPSKLNCSTAACSVTVTATTAGNLLLLLGAHFQNNGTAAVFSSASGDGTWTHCPSQAGTSTSGQSQQVDCAYILSATGGATTLTFTWGAGGATISSDVVLLELHRSTGTATYETCAGGGATACTTTSTTCSPCTGPTPTVTGNADVCAQWISTQNQATAVNSPWNVSPSPTIDLSNVEAGFGWSLVETSGHSSSWTMSSGGVTSMAAVCFK